MLRTTLLAVLLTTTLASAQTPGAQTPGAQTPDTAAANPRLPACLACHGAKGTSPADTIPSLGAMPSDYTLTQLYLFREKRRVADPMNAMAEGLTDDDLRSLGETIAQLPPPTPAAALPAAEADAAKALVTRYHCNSCHGATLAGQATIPRLAGQHEAYLARALAAYKDNARAGYSPAMNEMAQELKATDIPLLARYLATLP